MLVVLWLIAAALVVSVVLALRRWPAYDAPMPEDERNRARLHAPYLCTAGCALLAVDTAVISLVTRSGAVLVLAGLSAFLGLVFAVLAWDHRSDAWYGRYTLWRMQQGLPPRAWWDWRLD